MDKWFYETRNNYVDLIYFVDIMDICDILYDHYKSGFFSDMTFDMADEDCKNVLNCSIRRDFNNDIAETGIKYILSCSDGRELSLEYASLRDNYYLNIAYKLNDTENLLFQFRVMRHYKEDSKYQNNRFKKENINFSKYGKLKFKKSLLPYCRVVNRYGKVKESENMMKIHRTIIDSLLAKSFTSNELKLFEKYLNKKIQNEKESKVVRNSDNLLNREFIYRALVGDGISR
jgi:hypothetical protein